MNAVTFLSFWITNSVFFYIAYIVVPNLLVLGNNVRSPVIASMASGFLLTIFLAITPIILNLLNVKIKNENNMTFVYLVVNIIGIWAIARLALFTGFGISSFWVAILLGTVMVFLQGPVWKISSKIKSPKK